MWHLVGGGGIQKEGGNTTSPPFQFLLSLLCHLFGECSNKHKFTICDLMCFQTFKPNLVLCHVEKVTNINL
jgi:hypothetical protein